MRTQWTSAKCQLCMHLAPSHVCAHLKTSSFSTRCVKPLHQGTGRPVPSNHGRSAGSALAARATAVQLPHSTTPQLPLDTRVSCSGLKSSCDTVPAVQGMLLRMRIRSPGAYALSVPSRQAASSTCHPPLVERAPTSAPTRAETKFGRGSDSLTVIVECCSDVLLLLLLLLLLLQ